jgi:hypothetical protein
MIAIESSGAAYGCRLITDFVSTFLQEKNKMMDGITIKMKYLINEKIYAVSGPFTMLIAED